MYDLENYVIYSQLQVCKIDSIETPSFESDLNKKYDKMSPAFDDKNSTTIYVPVDSVDSLRPLSDAEPFYRRSQNFPK